MNEFENMDKALEDLSLEETVRFYAMMVGRLSSRVTQEIFDACVSKVKAGIVSQRENRVQK